MLINGERAPTTGMEKHFLKVIQGKALAASSEEKEWLHYWQTSISTNSTLMSLSEESPKERSLVAHEGANGPNVSSSSQKLEEILNEASYGKFRGSFERDRAYCAKWRLNFFFEKVRLGIEICNENSELTDVLLKQLERDIELEKLHITLLRLSNTDIFGGRKSLLSKLHKAWITASNAENRRIRRMEQPVIKTKNRPLVSTFGGGWTYLEQGEKRKGDGYFGKQKISEGIAGDRDAVVAMRRADWSDMKKRSRGD